MAPTVPIALALAACMAGCHQRKPPPSIDGLTAALERTAEQNLPAPATLASEQVILREAPGKVEAEAAEALAAASSAGGAGIRSTNSQGQVSVMATVPDSNLDFFKAALRHEKAAPEKPSASTSLVEVLIIKAASPSP